ncbi:hypothetical protein JST97_06070 [bacterium]|nr:hypothetical protein [bacterium]
MVADLLYFLLCHRDHGDVSTVDYPRVKNCLQTALMWEMERVQAIVVEDQQVVSGSVRPCTLGSEFEKMLASLERPEPQTHRWFMLRVDCEKGLLSDFFARRLHSQGLLEERTVKQLLVFSKTIYPRSQAGEARYQQLLLQLTQALEALKGDDLRPSSLEAEVLMTAFFLDAFQLSPKVLRTAPEARSQISRSSLERMLADGLLSPNMARATYQFSYDVQDLAKLGSELWEVLTILDPGRTGGST